MGMAAAVDSQSQSQFHVLAVDDSLIDRKLIERLLKTSSYQVTTVDSGSKALEFLGLHEEEDRISSSVSPINHQGFQVNLVITDYCMPGITGYDLLKKIKESSSLRNIPVVIMSSENVPSRISRCLEEGAEEFFLKPVQLSDLNKLKPYIMKTKIKDHNQQQLQQDEEEEEESVKSDSESPPQPQLQLQPQQSQQLQQQQQQSNNNNKRKAMEEGLSPERTRPRYDGIATVV